jgi:glyoxylase-like metal-dependent hydrolase (beta-lactamase superfamily II)
MEIAPGVHSIPAGPDKFMGMYAPNVYLVAGEQGALIDTGYFDSEAARARIEYIESLAPLKLSHILITHPHPDHVGGCRAIKEATGAEIIVHTNGKAGLSSYGITADTCVEDGAVLDIGDARLEVVYTPGHTRDSTCFYLADGGILFTGEPVSI